MAIKARLKWRQRWITSSPFSATTDTVRDHHFEALRQAAYLGDETVRNFIQTHNPDALKEMADRFKDILRLTAKCGHRAAILPCLI